MDGREEESIVTTPMRNRMRRHTRPAQFMSKSHKAESMAWGRPGNSTFSFSGEFPCMGDQQPVEIGCSRRDYTSSRTTGGYRPVRSEDMNHMPVINKHGVHYATGLAMLAVLLVILGAIFMVRFDDRSKVLDSIEDRRATSIKLTASCDQVRTDIENRANEMNIRSEAIRIGLISSRGVKVEYLDVPENAVITQRDQTAIQALASIWGN